MLDLPFPAGRHMDVLSAESDKNDFFKVKCADLTFSLSGVQNKVQQYALENTPANTAAYALRCVCYAVKKATENARKMYPGLEVVFSGGVASNNMLRSVMRDAIFAQPVYSTDNAMGVAVLAHRMMEE
jgi:N6-L-threonylcarbamoyladenine synthase